MRFTLVLLIALAAFACREPEQPEPPAAAATPPPQQTSTPQSAADADVDVTLPLLANAVARCEPAKTTFAPGETIQLTIDLNEAPEGLQVAARIRDAQGEEVAYVKRPGAGQKSVTLPIEERLDAGTYRLEGLWGGNLVCEHEVEVR